MLKNKISKIFSESFSIPLDLISEIPNAQFTGNKQINVDGCQGIKKYDKSEIIIRCKRYNLSIQGEGLSLLTFTQGRLCIKGKILSYQIEEIQ